MTFWHHTVTACIHSFVVGTHCYVMSHFSTRVNQIKPQADEEALCWQPLTVSSDTAKLHSYRQQSIVYKIHKCNVSNKHANRIVWTRNMAGACQTKQTWWFCKWDMLWVYNLEAGENRKWRRVRKTRPTTVNENGGPDKRTQHKYT